MKTVGKTWGQYGIKALHQSLQQKSSTPEHMLFVGLSTSIYARITAPVLATTELYAETPGIITIIKEYK